MTEVQLVHEADRADVVRAEVRQGEVIWNAPRPLSGRVTWIGPFVRGSLYAAGPRDAHQRANEDLDAVEIRFVTNAEVDAMVDARLAEAGYTRADYAEVDMGPAEIAAQYGLPWRDGG